MKIIDLVPNTKEWEEFRRVRIGASDCPAIMGAGYISASKLWEQKISGKKSYSNASMKRGTDLEPVAREIVNKNHGSFYIPLVVESHNGWQMASLDGYCPENKRLIEIKCPNEKIFKDFTESGIIPEYYLWQIQHQLCVTNLSECTLVLFNGEICSEKVIKRDEAMISQLTEKEYLFYQSLINFTPLHDALVVRDDEDMKEAVTAYELAKAARIEAQELERICFDGIIYLANEKNCICNGKQIKKMFRIGSVDYKKIEALKDIDLNKYRREPVEYWVID